MLVTAGVSGLKHYPLREAMCRHICVSIIVGKNYYSFFSLLSMPIKKIRQIILPILPIYLTLLQVQYSKNNPDKMNSYRDSGSIDPLNLNLGTRQRWVVTFWSGCFTPGTQWTGGQVGPEASLDILEKGEVSCLCCELNPGLSTHSWLLSVGISGLKFKVHGDHTLCNPRSVSLKWQHSRVPPAAPPLAACSLQLCSPQFSPQDLVSLAFHTLDPHQWNLQHTK